MAVASALCLVASARIQLENAKAAQSAIEKICAAMQSARILAEGDKNVLNVLVDDEAFLPFETSLTSALPNCNLHYRVQGYCSVQHSNT